jgi:hypothetical protein
VRFMSISAMSLSVASSAAASRSTQLQTLLPACSRRCQARAWQQQVKESTGRPRCPLASRVVAASTPERQQQASAERIPPPPEVEVRVVGFGSRGVSAVAKLISHGKVGKA